MASSSTPSSSTTTLTKKYEVFLSFRGLDTRQGFTSHLYDALCRKNIKTFRDDDELRRGVEISPALLRAIEESKIAVVIFSKNYASSEWCLAELAEIIKRMKLKELIVMPVFYNVDPSDVQELKGSYDCSFANNEEIGRVGMFSWFSWLLLVVSVCNSCKKKKLQEEVQKWREALTEASNQAGFDSSVIRPEAELVRKIVEAVWRELRSKHTPSPSDLEGLVGMHERIEQVKALLRLDMKDVRKIVGIWGMGGIGKTTIAEAVFKSISYKFDGACFIEKVGKRLEDGGSKQLQLDVLSKVLHEENLKLDTPIRQDIMGMLNQKKVFIVLDDVNDFIKLKSLSECLHQCGLGSRMIITSRDKQVLCNFEVDDHDIYEEKGLGYGESLKLFREYANPTEDCMALSKRIVNFAEGNPLALKVLGSFLKGKNKQVWESALNDLQGIVNPKVFDVLKISYDGLNDAAKDLFLDLACFNESSYVIAGQFPLADVFLDCQEYKLPLEVLVDRKLIEINMGMCFIGMHDLLQEMGREIVCSKSPKILGNRSRLWKQDDVIQILEKNTGTAAVEGIFLDVNKLEEDIDLSSEVFDKMDNLRIILFHSFYSQIKEVHLPNGLNCLPDELMILCWPRCPLRELPLNFKPKKLVKLDLSSSDIERLWKGTKRAPKLKWLDLSYCRRLTKIPNLSDSPLLVKVDLTYCKSLVDLTSSGQQLNNLRYLTLEGCINVTKFPLISENIETLNLSGTAIEEVPSSIQSLTKLTKLDLSECTRLKHISPSICKLKSLSLLSLRGCSQLEIFPEILETMESLKSLNFSRSAIKELPLSIGHLNGLQGLYLSSLEELYLSNCSKLDKLPDELGNLKSLKKLGVSGFALGRLPSSITSLGNLEELKCSRCSLMGFPEDIDCIFSLKNLELSGNMFERLPKSIKQLSKLETLSLSHCNMLQSLPEFPEGLQCLEAMDCEQLCQVPDASEFVRCINSKYYPPVQFIFANSFKLKTAVSNVFEESLRLMQRIKKESGNPSNQFSFFLPGNEIPEWFSGQSLESSIKIRVLRNDLVNRKFMGFAICAVLRVDEYNSSCKKYNRNHRFHCDFKIFKIGNDRTYLSSNSIQGPNIYMDSEHMLLGYFPFYSSSQNPEKLPDSDYLNILFEFGYECGCNGPKRCAVHPIYAEEPLEIIGATIQEIGETSGRRSDRSDENDEEVEPHPKRICTQEIKTLDPFH